MKTTLISLTAIGSLVCAGFALAADAPGKEPVRQPAGLVIQGERFLLNGKDFRIRSIALEPFMPGETPLVPAVKLDYGYALSQIKALNANTVYLLTGDPSKLQPAFFQKSEAEGLYVILGLWFSGEADDYAGHKGDFQNPAFKEHVKSLIRALIDKIHDLDGKDYSSRILYITLGNELLEDAVRNTGFAHRKTTAYEGKFVKAVNASPADCFLAEMADYLKSYEAEKYGTIHYLSHHTWPVVSPASVKGEFFDVISYNLYSYWPESVQKHAPGATTRTPYQGALEQIASRYPGKPFVVSEVGISVAPQNRTTGTDEAGQAAELAARWKDVVTSRRYIAGFSVHELFDQWWKDDGVSAPPPQDELEHSPVDREEWFGLIGVEGDPAGPIYRPRPAYEKLKELWKSER